MIALLFVLWTCLPVHAAGPVAAQRSAPPAQPAVAEDPLLAEFDALAKEFVAARTARDKRLDELAKQGEADPESKVANPVQEFWARFEALAQRGSCKARTWTALWFASSSHGLAEPARNARWRELLLAAAENCADSASARDLARSVNGLYFDAPAELVDEFVEAFVKKTTQRELAADALYRAAVARKRGAKDPASPKAAAFLERAKKDFGDTLAGRRARGESAEEVGLTVGKFAPDFSTKDADGVAFKLSDYRGKVVVLDFWGFW